MPLSTLWKLEDYWAIWLGFILLLVGLFLFAGFSQPPDLENRIATINEKLDIAASKAPYKTLEYYLAVDEKESLQARTEPVGKFIGQLVAKPKRWVTNPLDAFFSLPSNPEEADIKDYEAAMISVSTLRKNAEAAHKKAHEAGFTDSQLNNEAENIIDEWHEANTIASGLKKRTSGTGYNIFPGLIALTVIIGLVFSVGAYFMGKDC